MIIAPSTTGFEKKNQLDPLIDLKELQLTLSESKGPVIKLWGRKVLFESPYILKQTNIFVTISLLNSYYSNKLIAQLNFTEIRVTRKFRRESSHLPVLIL